MSKLIMQRAFNHSSGAVAVAQPSITQPIPYMAPPAQPQTQDEMEMQRLIEQVLGNQPLTFGNPGNQSGKPAHPSSRHGGHSKKERMLRRVQEEGKSLPSQPQSDTMADMKPAIGIPQPGFPQAMPPYPPYGFFSSMGRATPAAPSANPAQEAAMKRMQRQTADQEKKSKRRRLLEGPSLPCPPSLAAVPSLPPPLPPVSQLRSSSSEGSNTHSTEEAGPVMLDGAPLVGLPPGKALGRKKRLLRNRVSAQQAREKKKMFLAQLEARVAELESRNASLDQEANSLMQQNEKLRKRVRENIHKPAAIL